MKTKKFTRKGIFITMLEHFQHVIQKFYMITQGGDPMITQEGDRMITQESDY